MSESSKLPITADLWGFANPVACGKFAVVALALILGSGTSVGESAPDPLTVEALKSMTLESLMTVNVTSVSKTTEPLSMAAAAIHVLTQDDLRRSGATSLAEALRGVPGIEVARVNSHQWAVSARGFNDAFANKLLVLMDGRTVYTPLFSGVFWEELDTVLEDVERIEVIRGPGASLWGANAVNGVINITTKRSNQTQGLLVSGGGGTEERGFATVRYGGRLAEDLHFRVYGKYTQRDSFARAGLPHGSPSCAACHSQGTPEPKMGEANDAWRLTQGGGRLDWEPPSGNRVTLQGDFYEGRLDETLMASLINPPHARAISLRLPVRGGNTLARWTHPFSDAADLTLQAYYDYTSRDIGVAKEQRHTADVEGQTRVALGSRHDLVAGAGYRWSADTVRGTEVGWTDPPERDLALVNVFAQDTVTLIPERLHATAGLKLEHNDFTGWEVQPSVRFAWSPRQKHNLWAAVSRAVRTPSRVGSDGHIVRDVFPARPPLGLPTMVSIVGDPTFASETLVAYELGYRALWHERLTVDIAGFVNDYGDLRALRQGDPSVGGSPPRVEVPISFANGMEGETYGGEFAIAWQALNTWRLRAVYSLLQMDLRTTSPNFTASFNDAGSSPRHQCMLHSSLDLGRHLELDGTLRYTDGLTAYRVPGYLELNVRLAWRPKPNLELALVGQNVLDNRHPEFAPSFLRFESTEVQRGVCAKVTVKF